MKWITGEQLRTVGQMLRGLMSAERIGQALTRNVALKILSLVIAFGLWAFVNFGERDTEQSLKVPLELRNIPAHLMLTSPRVDFVDLRVVGPRTLLGRIDRNRLAIDLDLNGVRPGSAVFRVGTESLNLPRGVKVVRINPSQVTLALERIGHKSVPVHLHLVGKPPTDLQMVDTKVAPETVQVTGPASDVEDVHAATTEALDLSNAGAGVLEKELPLEATGDYLSFSATRVAVQVRIEEIVLTRDFKHVPVELRHAPTSDTRLVPDSVKLTVRGPKHLVSDLELDSGAVYIDADENREAGTRTLKPTVDLPQGVELFSVEPAELKLVIPAPKRPARRR